MKDYFKAVLTWLLASGQYRNNSIEWIVNRANKKAEEAARQRDCETWINKEEK